MKPHYTKWMDTMVDYIYMHHDSSDIKSRISHINGQSEVNEYQIGQFMNFNGGADITPLKYEKVPKFYNGNSLDVDSKENLKLKNTDLANYGFKSRSNSKQDNKERKSENSKRKHIIIEKSSGSRFETVRHNKNRKKNLVNPPKNQQQNQGYYDFNRGYNTFYKGGNSSIDQKLKSLWEDFNKRRMDLRNASKADRRTYAKLKSNIANFNPSTLYSKTPGSNNPATKPEPSSDLDYLNSRNSYHDHESLGKQNNGSTDQSHKSSYKDSITDPHTRSKSGAEYHILNKLLNSLYDVEECKNKEGLGNISFTKLKNLVV